jgi:hypothetical protein
MGLEESARTILYTVQDDDFHGISCMFNLHHFVERRENYHKHEETIINDRLTTKIRSLYRQRTITSKHIPLYIGPAINIKAEELEESGFEVPFSDTPEKTLSKGVIAWLHHYTREQQRRKAHYLIYHTEEGVTPNFTIEPYTAHIPNEAFIYDSFTPEQLMRFIREEHVRPLIVAKYMQD